MVSDYLLTGEDVCKIIETCGKSGVTQLKFGDLQVDFRDAGQRSIDLAVRQQHFAQDSYTPAEMGDIDENSDFERQTKQILDDAQDMSLLIKDPAAWEENEIESIFDEPN